MITQTRLSPLYKVELIADGRNHFYKIGDDDTFYPSSTTVLKVLDKPAILPWALNMAGDNIKEFFSKWDGKPFDVDALIKEAKNIYKVKASAAADVGTRVHGAINKIIHGETPEITDDIKPAIDGFLQWVEANKLKIEFGDTRLGSKLFGFGGSMDFLAFDGDDPIIFDVKTNRKRRDRPHGAYPEGALQLSSYRQAFFETYGLKPKACYILWINKEKPEFKAVKVANLEKCFEGFLAALNIYNLRKYELFDEEPII